MNPLHSFLFFIGLSAASLANSAAAFYAPNLGRWVSRDPIGYQGGGNNLYEYVGNHPVIAVDPSGLTWPQPLIYPLPTPEWGDKSCFDYADKLPTNGINEPHTEGQYRHCVAACCLTRRHVCTGWICIWAWDTFIEDRDEKGQGDMAGERSGICVSSLPGKTCAEACKDAMNDPQNPCHPKPNPPEPPDRCYFKKEYGGGW
jgi:hypothetical protein